MATGERRGFITGGTWCVDYNKRVSFWPGEDGIAEYLGEERAGGGSGCNLALDMRRLDRSMPVETISLVGDDEAGRFLLQAADEAGVDRRQMQVTSAAGTQITDAFVSEKTKRRVHLFASGAANLLTPEHFDFSATRARWLHLGLPGVHARMDGAAGPDANGWVSVLKKARAAGLKTNLELCSLAPEILARLARPCLPHLDALIVNDSEIAALSSIQTITDGVTDPAACERAARHVLEHGAMQLVAAHWPAMAVAVTRDGAALRMASVSVPPDEALGANGAGDAFASGLLYGLHEGWALEDCLRLAHAAAAASLRSLSTTGAVEDWRACLALAQNWGWR